MPGKEIAIYLNHHFAGVVAGLDMVEHLEAAEKGTPMARTLTELRADLVADRQVLEDLMGRLRVSESGTQKASAWLGGKMSRMRLRIDEGETGTLHLLEALESLSLGIEAKRELWLALDAVSPEIPALRGQEYHLLIARAEQQRERLEKLRMQAAAKVLRQAA